MKTRTGLLVATSIAVSAAAGVGYWLVYRVAPGAALPRLVLDGGLLVALSLVIMAFTRAPAERIDALSEALRDLAVGRRDKRFKPEEFGELAEIARGYNVIVATLGEYEDPNLGPVKALKRDTPEPKEPKPYQRESDEIDVGQPRVMSRERAREMAAKTIVNEPGRPPPLVRKPPDESELSEAPTKRPGPAEPETVDDRPPAVEESASEPPMELESVVETIGPRPAMPSRAPSDILAPPDDDDEDFSDDGLRASEDEADELDDEAERETLVQPADGARSGEAEEDEAEAEDEVQDEADDVEDEAEDVEDEAEDGAEDGDGDEDPVRALFDSFVEALAEAGADDEIDFDEFAETLESQRSQLIETHQCKDVRFEVAVVEGDVSLLPRLVR